jgi:hypothetical protein
MKKSRIQKTLRAVATAVLLGAWPGISFGAISGSFVINGDGTVTYSYVVDNTAGSFEISLWSLDFGFPTPDWNQLDVPSGGDVEIPDLNWFATAGVPVTGISAQDFLAIDPAGDVPTGQSLSGFSFTSHYLPGQIAFLEFSADGISAGGTTVGPAFLLSVPDGGVKSAEFAFAAAAMLVAARRIQRTHV